MSRRECLQRVETGGAPAAIGPYAQAVVCDGWVYCSGQIGLDPATGDLVDGGVEAQTRRVLANLAAVLAAAGVGVGDIVRATLYLTDMDDFATVNEVYADWLGDARPARATVEVSGLPRGASIEIDAIAHLGDGSRSAPVPDGPE
jgi:2-iminobutanoate/2-iminopropanoate deaminase